MSQVNGSSINKKTDISNCGRKVNFDSAIGIRLVPYHLDISQGAKNGIVQLNKQPVQLFQITNILEISPDQRSHYHFCEHCWYMQFLFRV